MASFIFPRRKNFQYFFENYNDSINNSPKKIMNIPNNTFAGHLRNISEC